MRTRRVTAPLEVVFHKSDAYARQELVNGGFLVQWEQRPGKGIPEGYAQDIIDSSRNSSVLPIDHALDAGVYIVSLPDGGICIYSDPGVPASLYYAVKDNVVFLSHTDRAVAELVPDSPEIDYAGVYQRLIYGYTIGPRTRYKGVCVLEPGSRIIIDEQGTIDREKLRYDHHDVALDDIWEALGEEIGKIENENIGIMLSAGYDSRLLLAACLGRNRRIDIAYTHGLLGSTELGIAYELAKAARIRTFIQMDAGSGMFGSVEELHAFFDDMGILYQVFWRLAGKYFASAGATPICGVQAEILNGQFMNGLLTGALSKTKRFMIGRSGYRAFVHSCTSFAEFVLSSVNPGLLVYIRPVFRELFEEAGEVTRSDLIALAESYLAVCDSWDEVVLRFLCAHDGSKLRAQQARILHRHCPVSAPFSGRKVFMLCNDYPNEDKLYGKAMRRLLSSYSPGLSKFRCTKSNLPLYYPDILHLIGRAVRSVLDGGRIIRFLESRGSETKDLEKISWIGGDVWIREGNGLAEIRGLVTGSILDRDVVDGYFDKIRNYRVAVGDGNDLLKLLEIDVFHRQAAGEVHEALPDKGVKSFTTRAAGT